MSVVTSSVVVTRPGSGPLPLNTISTPIVSSFAPSSLPSVVPSVIPFSSGSLGTGLGPFPSGVPLGVPSGPSPLDVPSGFPSVPVPSEVPFVPPVVPPVEVPPVIPPVIPPVEIPSFVPPTQVPSVVDSSGGESDDAGDDDADGDGAKDRDLDAGGRPAQNVKVYSRLRDYASDLYPGYILKPAAPKRVSARVSSC
ncbi:MAG: hypothetical protein AAGJ80_20750, partial [Cyanobacteria bacterium J06553_1]